MQAAFQRIKGGVDAITTAFADAMFLLKGLPINSVQILRADPADDHTVVVETGNMTNPFSWVTRDSDNKASNASITTALTTLASSLPGSKKSNLLTEKGNSKEGIDFVDVRAGRNKSLRLRVQFVHRHFLMFPFLRAVYMNVMERRAVSTQEEDVVRHARAMGVVQLVGVCVMQMQSNLTLGQ
jgi:hypothetical protein